MGRGQTAFLLAGPTRDRYLDTGVARIYDYVLGGRDNDSVDPEAVETVFAEMLDGRAGRARTSCGR